VREGQEALRARVAGLEALAVPELVVHEVALRVEEVGLRGYTRARYYSSPTFLVTIGILHIKEIGEGELQKALV
jgi:hypothetical protein